MNYHKTYHKNYLRLDLVKFREDRNIEMIEIEY